MRLPFFISGAKKLAKHRSSLDKHQNNKMNLTTEITPLTNNQDKAFANWRDGKNLVMHGYAGTGKTFVAMALALQTIEEKFSPYRKVMVIRSAVPSRDMGFLPGSANEKASAYEEPYEAIVNTLYGRGDAYSICKKSGLIDFRTTSYMRGVTYDQTILIIDEIQNMSDSELHTILTRVGESTRFILCGDFRQSDLKKEKSGLDNCLEVLRRIKSVRFVDYGVDDIVRSDFVRDYIIEREKFLHQN